MFRGWLALAGVELTNTSRLVAHARPGIPQSMEEALSQCVCRADYVSYDDSWPGLAAFLGDDPYTIANAPWYDPTIPQSSELLGFWVTSISGWGVTPVSRTVEDAIGPGGVAGPHRDAARQLTFEFTIVACTNAGAIYGLEWLACRLRPAKAWAGTTLDYLAAHPENSAAVPASLRRVMNRVVLTGEPQISQSRGTRGEQHRQGNLFGGEFTLGVLDPYTYGPVTSVVVDWDSEATEPLTWAHAPDCDDPGSCDEIPVLTSVECVPAMVDVAPVQPPVCAGCTPVCAVETRVVQIPAATGVLCVDQAVTLVVTAGAVPVSVNFWFRPCGAEELCDRTGFLSIGGLDADATVVADSVAGRAYAVVDDRRIDQRGIVSTPSGAPWTATVLDVGQCWELVAQHAPGLDFQVQLMVRGRSA